MSVRLTRLAALLAVGLFTPPLLAGEGRIPLWQPITITPGQEGHYIVTRDISVPAGAVISIQPGVTEVEIDLNGFTLDTTAGSNVIESIGAIRVKIRNGFLRVGDNCILAQDTRELVVEDVHCQDPLLHGMSLLDVHNYALRRNIIFGATNDGIRIDNFGGLQFGEGHVDDNQIWACGAGITVLHHAGFAVRNNKILVTNTGHGILIEDSYSCVIAGNSLDSVRQTGIALEPAFACKIYNNTIHESGGDGIAVMLASEDNLVLENNSSRNLGNGLNIDGRRNVIHGNVLNFNQVSGIWFQPAAGDNTYGGNSIRGNITPASAACGATPTNCLPPEICDDGPNNSSFNDNMAPGPPTC